MIPLIRAYRTFIYMDITSQHLLENIVSLLPVLVSNESVIRHFENVMRMFVCFSPLVAPHNYARISWVR